MQIKRDSDVEAVPVDMDGAKDVTIQILIGPNDGSQNIIVRLFNISPGGHTPYHTHDFEHLIQVRAGKGVAVDADGNEHDIVPGQSIFIPPNERHQFINRSAEHFLLTCTIPNPDRTCG